ncbi:hemolysin secretion protein D [Rhizobium sp. Root73]|uniref:efflux RND transporter periplasmic adaptor subunit n=1 Tax=unclassified Rhizobium TaxID=2613769 RepID=UPI000712773F|nr:MULTISPECIES: efflux RND transporter periplasmic adaptor subunit [unclassified Rhizobium]KQV29970.1 hemolysin secretion protein D [Rhizobium sp. Root1204]KQY01073.1 hemolysin secretion protein D [Rhizobium sp. Root1334]KRB96538.1 hemolysin secretion protein D [Rhizobium sp. Root73]
MARNTTFAFGISTALLLTLLSGTAFAQEAAKPEATQTLPSIVVTEVASRPIVDRVVATGAVKAVDETYVSPLVDGLSIRTLNADVGDRVEAESTLATLNQDMLVLQKSQYAASLAKAEAALAQYQAQLAEAQANADEAVRVSERSKKLAEAGSMSTAQRDQEKAAATAALARVRSADQLVSVAKADIKVVEAQISDVDLRLVRTDVKTPVTGVVSARTAKVGAIANGAGEPLFTIIRDGAVEMKAEIIETDLPKLEIGQKAKVTLADGKTQIDGRIRLISPVIDTQTRLGSVYISLLEPEKARVGMYARAQIIVTEKQALVLPLSAVTNTKVGMVARKVEGDVAHVAQVETGIQDNGYIEIRSGLKQGDRVITKAGAFVRDGDRIKPVLAAAETVSN